MYKVIVENPCSCFVKSKKPYELTYKSSFLAKVNAQELLDEMSNSFCHKHTFSIRESSDGKTFTILMQ